MALTLILLGKGCPENGYISGETFYNESGEIGLTLDNRGKSRVKKSSSKELSMEEQLKKAEARIAYLEVENDFLKKLEELERQALAKKKRY